MMVWDCVVGCVIDVEFFGVEFFEEFGYGCCFWCFRYKVFFKFFVWMVWYFVCLDFVLCDFVVLGNMVCNLCFSWWLRVVKVGWC